MIASMWVDLLSTVSSMSEIGLDRVFVGKEQFCRHDGCQVAATGNWLSQRSSLAGLFAGYLEHGGAQLCTTGACSRVSYFESLIMMCCVTGSCSQTMQE
jgi:hypothetical protein